jgi:hypothetical protein
MPPAVISACRECRLRSAGLPSQRKRMGAWLPDRAPFSLQPNPPQAGVLALRASRRRDLSDASTQLTGPCYQSFRGLEGGRTPMAGSGHVSAPRQCFKIGCRRMVKADASAPAGTELNCGDLAPHIQASFVAHHFRVREAGHPLRRKTGGRAASRGV